MLQKIKKDFSAKIISKPEFIDAMYSQHQMLFEYISILQKTDMSCIEIKENGVVFTTKKEQIIFFCTKADKRTAPYEIMNFGEYETEDADLLYKIISNGETIFDIGANIGWYSLVLSKKFPLSAIHSFEPLPETFASFVTNISMNQAEKVISNNFGFSNEAKTLKFYTSLHTSVSNSSQNITDDNQVTETECKVVTLDSYAYLNNISVDVIKCDVEGAELFVFQGGLQTIEKFKPIVFTEMLRKWSAKFGYHPNDIIDLFTTLGYQCFSNKGNHQLSITKEVTDSTINTNFFFLHTEKHASIISKYESK